jgi:hypothetical protein
MSAVERGCVFMGINVEVYHAKIDLWRNRIKGIVKKMSLKKQCRKILFFFESLL